MLRAVVQIEVAPSPPIGFFPPSFAGALAEGLGRGRSIGRSPVRQAARDDHRSLASLVERGLTEWLKTKGYLPKPDQ